jgi:hypothetical protein
MNDEASRRVDLTTVRRGCGQQVILLATILRAFEQGGLSIETEIVRKGSELRESEPVRKWISGLEKHYGPSDAEAEQARLQALSRFCAFIDATPEEIVERCFYRKKESGDLRISVKARRYFSERIDEFQNETDGSKFEKARAGNAIRSFLIHNGVLMQSGVQH